MTPSVQGSANHFAQSVHYASSAESSEPLRYHVERVVREYFLALGDELPTDLYELILKEVELPLFDRSPRKDSRQSNQVRANIRVESWDFT